MFAGPLGASSPRTSSAGHYNPESILRRKSESGDGNTPTYSASPASGTETPHSHVTERKVRFEGIDTGSGGDDVGENSRVPLPIEPGRNSEGNSRVSLLVQVVNSTKSSPTRSDKFRSLFLSPILLSDITLNTKQRRLIRTFTAVAILATAVLAFSMSALFYPAILSALTYAAIPAIPFLLSVSLSAVSGGLLLFSILVILVNYFLMPRENILARIPNEEG